jgi:hypothetical protein
MGVRLRIKEAKKATRESNTIDDTTIKHKRPHKNQTAIMDTTTTTITTATGTGAHPVPLLQPGGYSSSSSSDSDSSSSSSKSSDLDAKAKALDSKQKTGRKAAPMAKVAAEVTEVAEVATPKVAEEEAELAKEYYQMDQQLLLSKRNISRVFDRVSSYKFAIRLSSTPC